MRCESIPSSRLLKIFAVMLDRLRIPSPGGAIRVSWKHALPFVLYPFMLYLGSYGPFICILTFVVVMYGTTFYSQYMFSKKRKNIFVGCMIWAYLFYSYLIYALYFFPVYPQLSQSYLALQHVAIVVFIILYICTLSGAGFVPIRESSTAPVNYIEESQLTVHGYVSQSNPTETVISVNPSAGVVKETDVVKEFYKKNPQFVAQAAEDTKSKLPVNSRRVELDPAAADTPQVEAEDLVTGFSAYWPVLNSDWFYCTVCKMLVPPQSGHCRTCDRCVYELDHHCFWLDSCVGLRNKRWFILLLWSMVFGAGFNAYVVLKQVCPTHSWNCSGIFTQPDEMRLVYITTMYGLVVSLYQSMAGLRMLFGVSYNVSLVRLQKFMKSKMGAHMRGNEALPTSWLLKYHRGILRNWVRCLCPPDIRNIPTMPNTQTV